MLRTLGLLSAVFITASFVPYLRDIFKGTTKPERASWLIWSILGSIAFSTQLAKGATDSLWLTGTQTVGDLLIFLLSIKYGFGGFLKRDIAALGVALVSLLLWYLTSEAAVALILVIIIDGSGAVLTIIKSYKHPGSETMSAWILTALGGVLALLAVGKINILLLAFPIYIALINLAIVLAIQLGRRNSLQTH